MCSSGALTSPSQALQLQGGLREGGRAWSGSCTWTVAQRCCGKHRHARCACCACLCAVLPAQTSEGAGVEGVVHLDGCPEVLWQAQARAMHAMRAFVCCIVMYGHQ